MDKLPLLLVGSGFVGPRQAQVLLPLARPLYYLASPRHQPDHAHCQPIFVGNWQHEAALDQWRLYPGHAAQAGLAGPDLRDESSWHQLRRQIKGLPQTGLTAQDSHILLFLLHNRLDKELAEQNELTRSLEEANSRLLADLDNQDTGGEFLPAIRQADDWLELWLQAASLLNLPPAIWAMEQCKFELWREKAIPGPILPWPASWQQEQLAFMRQGLNRLWNNLPDLSGSQLAEQWQAMLTDQKLLTHMQTYCLPAMAVKGWAQSSDLLCLVWQ